MEIVDGHQRGTKPFAYSVIVKKWRAS